MRKRIVFLDRDGTVNVERNYLSCPEGMELFRAHLSAAARQIACIIQGNRYVSSSTGTKTSG